MDDLFGDDADDDEQPASAPQQQQQQRQDLDGGAAPSDDDEAAASAPPQAGVAPTPPPADGDDVEDLFGSGDEDEDGAPASARPAAAPSATPPPAGATAPRAARTPPGGAATRRQRFGEPISVSAPLLRRPPAEGAALLKLNNVLHIEPRAFDPSSFEQEEDIHYNDERGNARVMLRRGGNVLRWRWGRGLGGERVAQTNARLVKWSDGSESVMLGDQVGALPSSSETLFRAF
jgi:RNA polymerase-associated protein LEO1